MASGVYTILNLLDNKCLVGCTNDFYRRKHQHLSQLRLGKHDNQHLQNAVNKYGIENFEFEILEECPVEFLESMEHYWANLLDSHSRDRGYNILPTNPNGKHLRISQESKNKISIKNKGRKRPDNTVRMTGVKMPKESVEKMRQTKIGKKTKPWNPERREKFMNSMKKEIIQVFDSNNNIVLECNFTREAANFIGVCQQSASAYLAGKCKNSNGYTLKYKSK